MFVSLADQSRKATSRDSNGEGPMTAVDSTRRRNNLVSKLGEGVLRMTYRKRIYYTDEQKAQKWGIHEDKSFDTHIQPLGRVSKRHRLAVNREVGSAKELMHRTIV
jgi:hypothetical protein